MKLDSNLKMALIELLKHEVEVSSWGIYNIKVMENSANFCVDGLRYKGKVSIKPTLTEINEFEVLFSNGEKRITMLDSLIETLDTYIERTENYKDNIKEYIISIIH